MDLAPIQADIPNFQDPACLGQQQNLHKQILDLCQKVLPKMRDRVMIWMQSPGDIAHWYTFIGRFLDLA